MLWMRAEATIGVNVPGNVLVTGKHTDPERMTITGMVRAGRIRETVIRQLGKPRVDGKYQWRDTASGVSSYAGA